jgi:uncharacterized protein (TIGR00369 family)
MQELSHEAVTPADEDAVRRREVTWQDPLIGAALARDLSGLEYLTAIAEGRIPGAPIAALLGMSVHSVEPGRVAFGLDVGEHLYNPIGSVHGGVLATLLDTAAGCSVHSTLAPGELYTSLDLNVKFLRPVTVESGRLRCEGSVLQRGRRTALAQAQLYDAEGRLVAHATSTCMIFS